MARVEGIRGIVSFVHTAARGSFAAAAQELGVTPVAVSRNVQRLEQQLGVRLLQRSTRRLALTHEGRLFYERCARPLQELESARATVSESARSPEGTVRVSALTPFARTYVLPLLPAFSRRYPRIEIDLHMDDRVADLVAEGFDVGIRAGEPRGAAMVARDLAPLHLVVCGAPSYLALHGVPEAPADLARHNCLRLRGRAGSAANWSLGAQRVPVEPPVGGNFVANDITTLVSAAIHGQGLVFAPLPLVLPLLRAGALVPLLPDAMAQPARIFLHYPHRRLPARVRVFVDYLVECLSAHPDLSGDARAKIEPFLPGVAQQAALR